MGRSDRRQRRILGEFVSTDKPLLADETSIVDLDELRPLIAEGQEKGVLTFEQIATALEEVEVTKEQVTELHGYLDEQGIDVVGADGKAATSEAAKVEAAAEARRAADPEDARRSRSSTSRSSRRSTRCASTCAPSAACRC